MTTLPPITAGNIVISTVLFVPESGTVALADVTCKLRKKDGTEVDLTADVVEDVDEAEAPIPNAFRVDWASSETDPTGTYVMRWESNLPSPRIVVEDSTTSFFLLATQFTTP